MRKKPAKIRLIDDSAFLIQRTKPHEEREEPEFRSELHKDWVQRLPCLGCRACRPAVMVEGAHLRMWTGHNKAAAKPDDIWLWPGCPRCHRGIQHQIGEPSWWNQHLGIPDPPRFVLENYALKSPCPRTLIAAQAEYDRRYGT